MPHGATCLGYRRRWKQIPDIKLHIYKKKFYFKLRHVVYNSYRRPLNKFKEQEYSAKHRKMQIITNLMQKNLWAFFHWHRYCYYQRITETNLIMSSRIS